MDRDELHRRVTLLKEELEAGRLKIPRGMPLVESLKKVQLSPDGKVDPDSVDGDVRAAAALVAGLREREELKTIPLRDIQAAYFEGLEELFGKAFSEMKSRGLSPPDIAALIASSDSTVDAFVSDAEDLVAGIREFWEAYAPAVYAHVEDLDCLKSGYAGDIFPSYTSNIACGVGLYMDTIILPDPILKVAGAFSGRMRPERVLYLTAKHALNALTYRELALADVEPPIIVVAPSRMLLEEWRFDLIRRSADGDLVEHCSRLFDRQFNDVDEIATYLRSLSTPDELASAVADPTRLLFDTEWSGPLSEQLKRYQDETLGDMSPDIIERIGAAGGPVYFSLMGRMLQINDALFECSQNRASPLIDAPTSWQYLLWKYEYDRERSTELHPATPDVLISKALQAQGSDQLALISDLPASALIELRQRGAMAELREMLRHGISEIDIAAPAALSEVTEAVTANISDAFSKHKEELAEIAGSKRRFFGLDITPWIASGSIAIAAASTGNVPIAIIAAAVGLAGAPSGRDLWSKGKDIISTGAELKRSPVGILFRHLG